MTKTFRWRIDNVLFKAHTEFSVKDNREYQAVINDTFHLIAQLLLTPPKRETSDFQNYISHFLDWFLAWGTDLGKDLLPVLEVLSVFYRNHTIETPREESQQRQLIDLVLKTLKVVRQADGKIGSIGLDLLANLFFFFRAADCDAFLATPFCSLVGHCIEVLPRAGWRQLVLLLQNIFAEPCALKIELLKDIRVQRLLFESLFSLDLSIKGAAYEWVKALAMDVVSPDIHHYLCNNMVILTTILRDIQVKPNVGHLVIICRIVGALLRIGNLGVERGWTSQNVFIEALLNDKEAMESLENLATHGTQEIDQTFKTFVEKELPEEWLENFRRN